MVSLYNLYDPCEDSFLLAKSVRKLAFGKVLDMGSGSGIQAETALASDKVASVLAADINPEAVALLTSKGIPAVLSDLFSKMTGKFDTIIFNPPYLPAEAGYKDIALDGGKRGYEVIARFLSQVNAHLRPDGMVLLVFSSLTGREKINELVAHYGLEHELLDTLHIGFEDLFVYCIRKTSFTRLLEKKGISNIERLAKGHRGLIFTGFLEKKKVAIKVQRLDSGAKGTVNNEARRLKTLNKHKIGPKLLFSGKDYFAYEYVPGAFILDYGKHAGRKDILHVLKDVFLQMRTMDTLKLNKEEMHHPVKHVIITPQGRPVLLDFERCKPARKQHNVTQFCQFLRSGMLQETLTKKGISINKEKISEASAAYKKKMDDVQFRKILALLR